MEPLVWPLVAATTNVYSSVTTTDPLVGSTSLWTLNIHQEIIFIKKLRATEVRHAPLLVLL